MSIDVEVFPAHFTELTLSQVEACMRELGACRPSLGITRNEVLLAACADGTTSIEPDGLYYVPFGCRSLTLNIHDLTYTDFSHFRYNAERIPIEALKRLAEQNAKVGFYFNLDSKMARGRDETSLLLLLAASLAKLTDGLIILEDHPVENVPQGGYWWHEIMERFQSFDGVAIEPQIALGLRLDVGREE